MNKKIDISEQLRNVLPQFRVGVLKFNGENLKNIDFLIEEIEDFIYNNYDLSDVLLIEGIKHARDGYKALHKDPSRYRLAVESLYRRIVKGNKLYRIHPLVDFGNYISLKCVKSVAMLDYNNIVGNIIIRVGQEEDDFYGIGRGKLNIENIPVYTDDLGPFGSTTSDHTRTMVTDKTSEFLMFIISFDGVDQLKNDLQITKEYLLKYVGIQKIDYEDII